MHDVILDLDVGNSYTKWRVGNAGYGYIDNFEIGQLKEIAACNPSRIRVACVAGDGLREKLSCDFEQYFDCIPEFACVTTSCSGLRNGYGQPEKLGVDRWLAALSAWRLSAGNACLIVDAGSALTVDTINDDGIFQGGYIVPGLVMMQRSLVGNTGQITCNISSVFAKDFLVIPVDTEQAVQKGACFAVTAVVEKAVLYFLKQWPRGEVYITGGNGFDIVQALGGMDGRYQPDLVLEGLALALP